MKFSFFAVSLFVGSISFAGVFGSDVEMSGTLKIFGNQSEISLDDLGKVRLAADHADIRYDHAPMFGKSELIIKQGPQELKLKIPKNRYHTKNTFTVYAVDERLNYDIYMRTGTPELIDTKEVQETENCMVNTLESVDDKGVHYVQSPGLKTVLNRVNKIKTVYTLSFVSHNQTFANLSEDKVETVREHVKDIGLCLGLNGKVSL